VIGLEQHLREVPLTRVMPFNAVINDVIHGYIPYLKDVEASIIDTWVLQRLRYIYQLQLTHLVYPSATHTRFNHSLGVMHLAYKFMNTLLTRIEILRKKIPYESARIFYERPREVLLAARIVGLLHDIGHGPFSHSFDRYVYRSREYLGYRVGNHEIMGYLIYRDYLRKHIHELLRSSGIGLDADTVVELVDQALKPPKGAIQGTDLLSMNVLGSGDFYLSELSSTDPVDQAGRFVRIVVRDFLYPADILDYLIRDSYYTKTPIGMVNADWLILQTYIVSHDSLLVPAISDKGIDDLIRLLNARKFMYKNVYLHPVNLIFDELMGTIFECDEVKSLITETIDKMVREGEYHLYTALTDHTIYGMLLRWSNLSREKLAQYCGDQAERVLETIHGILHYRKIPWKKIARLFFKREIASQFLSQKYGKRMIDLLVKGVSEVLRDKLGISNGEDEIKIKITKITAYPTAAKEVMRYLYIARVRGEAPIDFRTENIDSFVRMRGVEDEVVVTVYLWRNTYNRLPDEMLRELLKIIEEEIKEITGLKEIIIPETS